ncbi:hypothetical protein ACJMK2_017702 [Sinanodonta woodiana]|uniref:Integrase core domain-containing protein n=1 Tax=Sinanodonta woodiana TaxID=1069815 RepID=A0ABD3UEZ6_SINWO
MRTLKRILRYLCLRIRRFHSEVLEVAQFIAENVSNSGNQQGNRWMHLRCLQHGLILSTDTVGILMQLLDPAGIQLRLMRRLRRRQYFGQGPDYIWHVDSYDELKQYGLCINRCIDGFSKQVIWLNVYIASSNPKVIAGYYVEAVRMRHGCPGLNER